MGEGTKGMTTLCKQARKENTNMTLPPNFSHLPPEEGIREAEDWLADLAEQKRAGRVHFANGTRLPDELFDVGKIVHYLCSVVKAQQEEIEAFKHHSRKKRRL